MTVNKATSRQGPEPSTTPSEEAKRLVRSALKGALATLDAGTGAPYASLLALATGTDGAPVTLISRLAIHTQNLLADARASMLFDGTGGDGNPLAGGRVSVSGALKRTEDPALRRRFLARHPEAAGYADFADFAFYRLEVERAHYVGGFGRIVSLPRADLLTPLGEARSLIEAEADIVAHMNVDHSETVVLYATALLGAPARPWRVTGIDPEGCDIVCEGAGLRLGFAAPVSTPEAARQEFVRLAALARGRAAQG
jgi:putative heme iron utilization protein